MWAQKPNVVYVHDFWFLSQNILLFFYGSCIGRLRRSWSCRVSHRRCNFLVLFVALCLAALTRSDGHRNDGGALITISKADAEWDGGEPKFSSPSIQWWNLALKKQTLLNVRCGMKTWVNFWWKIFPLNLMDFFFTRNSPTFSPQVSPGSSPRSSPRSSHPISHRKC